MQSPIIFKTRCFQKEVEVANVHDPSTAENDANSRESRRDRRPDMPLYEIIS